MQLAQRGTLRIQGKPEGALKWCPAVLHVQLHGKVGREGRRCGGAWRSSSEDTNDDNVYENNNSITRTEVKNESVMLSGM